MPTVIKMVCSVRYVPRYTDGITATAHFDNFGTSIPVPGTDIDIHFGKFGSSIPVPDTSMFGTWIPAPPVPVKAFIPVRDTW